jgi:predicted nucleic acid-binding protein
LIVVDASAINAVLLREDEAESVLKSFGGEEGFLAPALLLYEVANTLATARRRGRLDDMLLRDAELQLFEFPWAFETAMGPEVLRENIARAVGSGLTAYDAALLNLAVRHRCPLVTLDRELRRVAQQAGVQVRP